VFSTTWGPYLLAPDATESIDKQEYYVSKFGEARTAMMQQRLAALGEQEGIKFKFGGRTGNTRDSHSK
jgi:predicted DsbA family dithiol-disulfide isomerase